jgi:hypothetical protein
MSLPIRIHYQGQDYTYKILTRNISKDTQEIKISFNDEEYTLVANTRKEWTIAETCVGDQHELLQAIAKNIVLRYHL